MTAPTLTQTPAYTIEWDAESGLHLVLDSAGDHIADGETRREAVAELNRLIADDLRTEIERKLWDGGVSLETLEKVRALLGA